jgi:hypothetical protein
MNGAMTILFLEQRVLVNPEGNVRTARPNEFGALWGKMTHGDVR